MKNRMENKRETKRERVWIEMSVLLVVIIGFGIKRGFNYPLAYDVLMCVTLIVLDVLDMLFKFSEETYKRIKIVRKILKVLFWIGVCISRFFGYDSLLIRW